ncbi:hypothetical protein KAX75_02370, partial [candidate division WOR-3 bacterium]|nr:hypothetical protein [candidate division WOR-3 bacterium]
MDRYKRLIILITSICLIASILNAEGIYTLQFNKNDLSFGKIDGYDIINMKGCIPQGETGFPLLPHKRIEILIPSNKRFIGIKVLNKFCEKLSSSFTIYPAQPPVPLNGNP